MIIYINQRKQFHFCKFTISGNWLLGLCFNLTNGKTQINPKDYNMQFIHNYIKDLYFLAKQHNRFEFFVHQQEAFERFEEKKHLLNPNLRSFLKQLFKTIEECRCGGFLSGVAYNQCW